MDSFLRGGSARSRRLLTLVVVYAAAGRRGGRPAALLAVALFASHLLVWEWITTVKTHAVTMLLVTSAVVVACGDRMTAARSAAAGALAGAAIASRLLVVPVLIGVAVALALRPEPARTRARWAAAAAVGCLSSLLPVFLLCAASPSSFWFDNITYHAIRHGGDALVEDVAQKLESARTLFLAPLFVARPDSTGLQTTALFAVTLIALRRAGRTRLDVALCAMTLGLLCAAFLPSPVWTQYFAVLIAPCAIVSGGWLGQVWPSRRALVALLAGAYALSAVPAFQDRLTNQPEVLRPAQFDAVGRAVANVTRKDDRVAAHFPAYLVASDRPVLDAADNQFARLYSDRVPPEIRRRHHLHTEAELRDALLAQRARAFVVGQFVVPETALALRDSGWRRVASLPGASVWVPPSGSDRSESRR